MWGWDADMEAESSKMGKEGLRRAEPRILRLDQWGSEKQAKLTVKRVYDLEWE